MAVEAGYPMLEGGPRRPAPSLDVDSLVQVLSESATDVDGQRGSASFASSRTLTTIAKKRLKKLFNNIDIDGNGSIELTEFRKLIMQADSAELGLPQCQLSDVFDVADCNSDGEVNYNEFLAWLGLGSSFTGNDIDELLPEAKARVGLDGPTRYSVGQGCWDEVEGHTLLGVATFLDVWKADGSALIRLQRPRLTVEKQRLALGEMEAELMERRVRARGAVRRWVADNYSVSSKKYMKEVEMIEKRDKKKEAELRARENDPEEQEAAQLSGWTLTKKLEQLGRAHAAGLAELTEAALEERSLLSPSLQAAGDNLSKNLFPTTSSDPPLFTPLHAEQELPGSMCSLSTSIDSIFVPGEDVIACVNIQVMGDSTVDVDESSLVGKSAKEAARRALKKITRSVDLLVVLDTSASMVEELPVISVALRDMVDNMGEHDRLSFLTMSTSADVLLDWTEMSPTGRAVARDSSGRIQTQGENRSRYMAVGKLLWKQLARLSDMDKAAAIPTAARQRAVVFLSDGRPEEARDAVFSYFARGFAANPDVLFSMLAIGPESDAALMAELARCASGRMFYLPDEHSFAAVLGHVWGAARSTAIEQVFVALRPLKGCAIEEAEDSCSVRDVGSSWNIEEVKLSIEELNRTFRCVISFANEKEAMEECKFVGGDGEEVHLSEPIVRDGRVLATCGQRLLRVRRSQFLPEKAETLSDLHFEAHEDAEEFRERPAKKILVGTISKGSVELEFRTGIWSDTEFALAKDVVTDDITVFRGSKLIGYKFGESGSLESEELVIEDSDDPNFMIDVMESLVSAADTRHLTLVFDVRTSCTIINLGSLQHCSSRKILVRLRVPDSLRSPPRGTEAFLGSDVRADHQMLEVCVGGRPVVDEEEAEAVGIKLGNSTVVVQRVGLHSGHVPFLAGVQSPLTIRLALAGERGSELDLGDVVREELAQALVAAACMNHETIQATCIRQQSVGIVDIQLRLETSNKADAIAALCSKSTLTAMAERGFSLRHTPEPVGLAARCCQCQWRLVQGLRLAADSPEKDLQHLQEVARLCRDSVAEAVSPSCARSSSVLTCLAIEAVACQTVAEQFECWRQRLHGLAAAHGGQYLPTNALSALEIFATQMAWVRLMPPAVVSFVSKATARLRQREEVPEPVKNLEIGGQDIDCVAVRFTAVSGNGCPVSSYTVFARDIESGKCYKRSVRSTKTNGEEGFEPGEQYHLRLEGLPRQRNLALAVSAWNGRMSPASDALFSSTL
eukprot:TRINITY_DN33059_c0_g1_i1.p1 TRINITY_DN33059_c0_g1~~TRINITY_DN33059_c0_g1_i1.p1  ORF type:complete len:1248 (+),score=218.49 TRINITY_DN33059_c0_g1_i1:46-3789(+)